MSAVILEDPPIDESTKASALEEMIEKYLQHPTDDKAFIDKLALALFHDPRARGICRKRAFENGVDLKRVEEVIQRVMIVFFAKMLPKIRASRAVYYVIWAIADNVSREVLRDENTLTYHHDSVEAMHDRGEELTQVGLVETEEFDLDLFIDQNNERARFMTDLNKVATGEMSMGDTGVFNIDAVPFMAFVPPSTEPEEEIPDRRYTKDAYKNSTPGRRKGQTRTILSTDQQELVSIGEEMGVRNQDYAVLLGIGLPRLSSYIYGRTASVSKEVMAKARQLLEEHKTTNGVRANKFDKPMSDILAGWEQRLGTTENTGIANLIGVTTMTIHRWKKNENKPDATALTRYDHIVSTLEARMARINA
jgi:DNA-binding transcriptional regulator YiaG